MFKHFRYATYVIRHRWFVLVECWRVGLYWRGIIHDISKFSPREWLAYADHFYGRRQGAQRDSTGYYKPTDTGDPAFDLAWLHHAHSNDHHWQWWTQPCDDGQIKVFHMSPEAALEMVCDWRGAARAQRSTATVNEWYAKNRSRMLLAPETRLFVETLLDGDLP